MKKKSGIIKTPIVKDSEEAIMEEEDIEDKEKNIYKKEGDEELEDNDEIEEKEEGFMKVYDGDSNPTECAFCHKILTDNDNPVEEEINEVLNYFCSEDHAFKFKHKKK